MMPFVNMVLIHLMFEVFFLKTEKAQKELVFTNIWQDYIRSERKVPGFHQKQDYLWQDSAEKMSVLRRKFIFFTSSFYIRFSSQQGLAVQSFYKN